MFEAISRDDSFTYNMPPYGPAGMAGPIGPRGPRDQTNPLFGADIMRSREGVLPAAWPRSDVCGRGPGAGRLCVWELPAALSAGTCLPQGLGQRKHMWAASRPCVTLHSAQMVMLFLAPGSAVG